MGKISVIITGATGSIGREAVVGALKRGANVIMACRNVSKAEEIKQQLSVEYDSNKMIVMYLDMINFCSVKSFVEELKSKSIVVDGILNNAGVMNRFYKVTADGFESTLQTNYLSVVLLTRLLMPIMQPNSNIVNTISLTRKIVKLDENFFSENEKDFRQLKTYSKSKYALLLYTAELSKRFGEKFFINATDPGIVNSNMISMQRWFDPLADVLFRPFIKSPQQGAIPALNALFSQQKCYLYRGNSCDVFEKKYLENKLSEWLWNKTEEILKPYL